jgi:hypothetical protein
MPNQYLGYDNVFNVLAPIDCASNITATQYVPLKGVNRLSFLVNVGVFTPAATTDFEVITVEAATLESGTETAIAYSYRLSGISASANTWGAITAVGATGTYYTGIMDGRSLWIDVDPDALAASNYRYVRVKLTDDTNSTVCLACVNAFVSPKYRMTTFVSLTACASV